MRTTLIIKSLLIAGFLFLHAPLYAADAVQSPKHVSLQDTINATLQHHRGLKTIQENREVVIHELRRAKAGWGPRVDTTARAGGSRLSDTTTRPLGDDKGLYQASSVGIVLVQPLWDGFATRSRVRTAEATVESMTNRVFDNATTLALDSIIAHIDLLRRREILRLAELNVQRHREILVSSKDRQAMGTDTVADLTQTQGRLARALSTLSEAKAALRDGEDFYRRITGMPVPKELDPVVLPSPMYQNQDEVFMIAKDQNPKLKAYLRDIEAAAGEKELAQAAFHPVINLEVGPNYSERGGSRNQWTSSLDVMGTMRWNLFNSGADQAEVRAASSRVRQSRQFMFDFIDSLLLEIQNSWTAYIAANEQYAHYTEAIGYNAQTRDAYLEQFFIGQRSLLDVLDAESELFNSSTQAVTAQGNILVSGYRMYALAGVLLPDLHIDTKALYDTPPEEAEGDRSK